MTESMELNRRDTTHPGPPSAHVAEESPSVTPRARPSLPAGEMSNFFARSITELQGIGRTRVVMTPDERYVDQILLEATDNALSQEPDPIQSQINIFDHPFSSYLWAAMEDTRGNTEEPVGKVWIAARTSFNASEAPALSAGGSEGSPDEPSGEPTGLGITLSPGLPPSPRTPVATPRPAPSVFTDNTVTPPAMTPAATPMPAASIFTDNQTTLRPMQIWQRPMPAYPPPGLLYFPGNPVNPGNTHSIPCPGGFFNQTPNCGSYAPASSTHIHQPAPSYVTHYPAHSVTGNPMLDSSRGYPPGNSTLMLGYNSQPTTRNELAYPLELGGGHGREHYVGLTAPSRALPRSHQMQMNQTVQASPSERRHSENIHFLRHVRSDSGFSFSSQQPLPPTDVRAKSFAYPMSQLNISRSGGRYTQPQWANRSYNAQVPLSYRNNDQDQGFNRNNSIVSSNETIRSSHEGSTTSEISQNTVARHHMEVQMAAQHRTDIPAAVQNNRPRRKRPEPGVCPPRSSTARSFLRHSRGVLIKDIPRGVTVAQACANVRGGTVERFEITVTDGVMDLGVFFCLTESAWNYAKFTHNVGGIPWAGPEHSAAPPSLTGLIGPEAGGHNRLFEDVRWSINFEDATRNIIIQHYPDAIGEDRIIDDIRQHLKLDRLIYEHLESNTEPDSDPENPTGSLILKLMSIEQAIGARDAITKNPDYKGAVVSFISDHCDGSIRELSARWRTEAQERQARKDRKAAEDAIQRDPSWWSQRRRNTNAGI